MGEIMRLVRRVVVILLSLFCCLGPNSGHASNGGIYTDLFDFDGTHGANPFATLTLNGGVFYGTATSGGTSTFGVIFSFDPSSSTYTDLVNFTGNAGAFPGSAPAATLTLNGGIFYGTAQNGGASGNGVIFSFDPSSSAYTDLINFTGNAGAFPGSDPLATLTLNGGVFYGTTFMGGASGVGVIFSFDPSTSTYTVVHNFDGTNGSLPEAALTLSGGVFYGTTAFGGASGNGVIFSFDPSTSTYTDLHDFDDTNGSLPAAALTLSGEVFYGTTAFGGASGNGVIFSFDPSTSTYTDLHDFDGTNGSGPFAPLTLSGGVFYGTTMNGGMSNLGVIFSFDPSSSTYTVLYNFDGTHGSLPEAALTLSGGIFYGTATNGGASDLGVIFSFAPLLPPSNLTGHQKKNNSGARYEWFNGLKWQTPTLSGTEAAGYNIYRDGVKIATLSPSTLHYNDHNRKKGVKTLYSVTTINVQGNESSRVNITVP